MKFSSTLFQNLLGMIALSIAVLFTQPTLYAQGNLVGSATSLGNNCYQLTPDAPGQGGAVWMERQLNLNHSFVVNATVYLGTKDGNGADGIAFVLQQLGCGALGQIGGGIGYFSLSPSLAVEYDTWQNDDPAADHIAIVQNGDGNHFFSPGNTLAGPYTLNNIEDGANHSTVISWDAGSTTLSVYFDNALIGSYSGDVVNNIFGGNPNVFWGFTGATGGFNNLQTVCINSVAYPCGNNGKKVTICHIPPGNNNNPQTLCISPNALAAHLAHGDVVGPCTGTCSSPAMAMAPQNNNLSLATTDHHGVDVFPNPSSGEVKIQLDHHLVAPVEIQLFNAQGKKVWRTTLDEITDSEVNVNLTSDQYGTGLYFVSVTAGDEKFMVKLVMNK